MNNNKFNLSLPVMRGGGSELVLKTARTTDELLSDKISQEQADLLYKPLGDSSSGTYTSTPLWTSSGGNWGSNLTLSESWKTFDKLHVTGGDDSWISLYILDVPAILGAIEVTGRSRFGIWSGGKDIYWRCYSSSDGLYLYLDYTNGILYQVCGINEN